MFNVASRAAALLLAAAVPAGTLAADNGFQVIHEFAKSKGGYPNAELVQGDDGGLYGTTQTGGSLHGGVAFRLTPKGSYSVIHAFLHGGGKGEGWAPWAGLTQGADGSFYGTTHYGGKGHSGTLFKVTAGGEFTLLHEFDSADSIGAYPSNRLLQASDGYLYGTTGMTAYRVSPAGEISLVHTFTRSEGVGLSALIEASDGNFYGTARNGGGGHGSVYRMTPVGEVSVLHTFNGNDDADGEYPEAPLLEAADGNFYGTTEGGGHGRRGAGIVFKLTPAGEFSVLHRFKSAPDDGASPQGALIQATNGEIYGVTLWGGVNNGGTVYRLRLDGRPPKLLHEFAGPDGAFPSGALVQASNGRLYGTASTGGGHGGGTAFSIQPN